LLRISYFPILILSIFGCRLLILLHDLESSSSKFQIVPNQINDLHKSLRAAKFHDNPNSHQPIPLTSFLAWPGQSIIQSCSSTICAVNFSLTNLQLHKSALPIYPPVGMAANTPRHCFGQPAVLCTSYTFDTVTNHKLFKKYSINMIEIGS